MSESAVSYYNIVDRDELEKRLDDGTHTVTDQVYLLYQAVGLSLVKMMNLSMEYEIPEAVAETVADVLVLMVLSAPQEERETIRNEILAGSDS